MESKNILIICISLIICVLVISATIIVTQTPDSSNNTTEISSLAQEVSTSENLTEDEPSAILAGTDYDQFIKSKDVRGIVQLEGGYYRVFYMSDQTNGIRAFDFNPDGSLLKEVGAVSMDQYDTLVANGDKVIL